MNYTIESSPAFQILGISRVFHETDAQHTIPAFWDEYYAAGHGTIACGQFGYCFDETSDHFRYAIGNRCAVDASGTLHIHNRPDRPAIPDGFELLTVPAHTWMKVKCVGPLPYSIQHMYPIIAQEWPKEYEKVPGCNLEEYGLCQTPEDSQQPDYTCFIWIPVRPKVTILSLREHPDMLDQFVKYFSAHWGRPELYHDCMQAALTTSSPLPQWYLAALPNHTIVGCCGLITNDFISRMDLCPWLCALWVDEACRKQGIARMMIDHAAGQAKTLGFPSLYCCTDHTGFYERIGFRYIGIGYHPWNETSRIYERMP